MKFGIITYQKKPHGRDNLHADDIGIFNIGDNIQMIAIQRIYLEELQIREEDIIEIDFHDLNTYHGDYVVVLINLFFFGAHDMKETWFPCSPYIIPIFIGLHLSSKLLTTNEILFFQSYSPIGCRDEYTLETMRRYGIEAYLFGCASATFPKREDCDKDRYNTIFLVDVNEKEITERLPIQYTSKKVEIVHHVIRGDFTKKTYDSANNLAKQLLNKYRDEAFLVITSRLHCASPCAAMGIPTIMVVKEKSKRFSWLEKLVPIYDENEYDSIDWDVKPLNYEYFKQRMIDFIKLRVNDTLSKISGISEISNFFEFRGSGKYVDPFYRFFKSLKELLDRDLSGFYLWGGTALSIETYDVIQKEKPELKFYGLIDEYNDLMFMGKHSISFDKLNNEMEKILLIITPTSSAEYIKSRLLNSNIKGMALFADGSVVYL